MTEQYLAVEIIGHRGAAYDAPENTLAAVKLAWKQNADAVEVDVHLSRDGKIVVFHDRTPGRIAGKHEPVADQTLLELQELDVGRWKGEQFKGERIPTLRAVLATVPEAKRLFIEIKCGPEIVPELERVLRRSEKKLEQSAVIASSLPSLQAIKDKLPKLSVFWVASMKQDQQSGKWLPTADALIRCAKRAGVDGLDLGQAKVIDSVCLSRIRKAGLECYVWTVDSEQEARRLAELGVDGITTNRPGWLRKRLSVGC